VLEQVLDTDAIRVGVAAVLSAERVSVISDWAQYPARTAADVVCTVKSTSGALRRACRSIVS